MRRLTYDHNLQRGRLRPAFRNVKTLQHPLRPRAGTRPPKTDGVGGPRIRSANPAGRRVSSRNQD